MAADTGADPARAQGKLEARYSATVGGIEVGKGAWVIDIAEDQFTAAASGRTSGLMQVFAGGSGSTASRGTINPAGRLSASAYAANVASGGKTDEVRMVLASGNVKDVTAHPPLEPNPDRVPVTDAHRRGILDPMTASLVSVAGSGDPLTAEACRRTLAIFDGRQRLDLELSFKRTDTVKAEKGYQGAVVVCSVHFNPIAGHRPSRASVKYLIEQRDIEMWLAPIAGTRVLVPFRLSVPTPIGLAVLEAKQFLTSAQPRRPAPATAKTQ